MKTTVARAPVSLLLDPKLMPSAKVVWMVLRLHARSGPVGPARLQACSGLSRPAVLRALARLAAAGWCAVASGNQAMAIDRAPAAAEVMVPNELLADRRVGSRGKVLYGILQLMPGFRNQAGQFTYASLSSLARASRSAVKRAVRDLAPSGWLRVAQANRIAPIRFALDHPVIARGEVEVARARHRLEKAPYRGEALMREYLSLLVDSDDFEDNAAPGFLLNPLTDERMELDRFYPPGVAFEYNGPQHYGATDRFSREDAAKQRARDYMKLGICVTRGIRLVVVHAEDLTLQSMRQKVGDLLPLRDPGAHEPLAKYLESVSRPYRLKARRGRQTVPA